MFSLFCLLSRVAFFVPFFTINAASRNSAMPFFLMEKSREMNWKLHLWVTQKYVVCPPLPYSLSHFSGAPIKLWRTVRAINISRLPLHNSCRSVHVTLFNGLDFYSAAKNYAKWAEQTWAQYILLSVANMTAGYNTVQYSAAIICKYWL